MPEIGETRESIQEVPGLGRRTVTQTYRGLGVGWVITSSEQFQQAQPGELREARVVQEEQIRVPLKAAPPKPAVEPVKEPPREEAFVKFEVTKEGIKRIVKEAGRPELPSETIPIQPTEKQKAEGIERFDVPVKDIRLQLLKAGFTIEDTAEGFTAVTRQRFEGTIIRTKAGTFELPRPDEPVTRVLRPGAPGVKFERILTAEEKRAKEIAERTEFVGPAALELATKFVEVSPIGLVSQAAAGVTAAGFDIITGTRGPPVPVVSPLVAGIGAGLVGAVVAGVPVREAKGRGVGFEIGGAELFGKFEEAGRGLGAIARGESEVLRREAEETRRTLEFFGVPLVKLAKGEFVDRTRLAAVGKGIGEAGVTLAGITGAAAGLAVTGKVAGRVVRGARERLTRAARERAKQVELITETEFKEPIVSGKTRIFETETFGEARVRVKGIGEARAFLKPEKGITAQPIISGPGPTTSISFGEGRTTFIGAEQGTTIFGTGRIGVTRTLDVGGPAISVTRQFGPGGFSAIKTVPLPGEQILRGAGVGVIPSERAFIKIVSTVGPRAEVPLAVRGLGGRAVTRLTPAGQVITRTGVAPPPQLPTFSPTEIITGKVAELTGTLESLTGLAPVLPPLVSVPTAKVKVLVPVPSLFVAPKPEIKVKPVLIIDTGIKPRVTPVTREKVAPAIITDIVPAITPTVRPRVAPKIKPVQDIVTQAVTQPAIPITAPVPTPPKLKVPTPPSPFIPLPPVGLLPLPRGVPRRRPRALIRPPKARGGFQPNILGILSGITIKEAPKGRLTGLEARFPIERKGPIPSLFGPVKRPKKVKKKVVKKKAKKKKKKEKRTGFFGGGSII